MNDFDRSIDRMKKVVSACDELLAMARRDIEDLEKRKQNALLYIKEAEYLTKRKPLTEYAKVTQVQARMIADGELAPVVCMGLSMKV